MRSMMRVSSSCLIFWSILSLGATKFDTKTSLTASTKVGEKKETIIDQHASAEKLVRFRRQPPVTIVKHVIRSSSRNSKPRRRVKRPKVQYGPPLSPSSHAFDDHQKHSKPHYSVSSLSEMPAFNIEKFQYVNLDANGFELPLPGYESQSMDLDFYSHAKDDSSNQHVPTNYAETDEFPALDFGQKPQTEYSFETSTLRKPHLKYGIPKQQDYTAHYTKIRNSFLPDDVTNFNSYQLESSPFYSQSSSNYGNGLHKTNTETESSPPLPEEVSNIDDNIPSTFLRPSNYFDSSTKHQSTQYQNPSNYPDTFEVYDKKITNTNYKKNFENKDFSDPQYAQSPRKYSGSSVPSPKEYPTSSVSDVEVTYSPSYEINLLSSNQANIVQNHQHPSFPAIPEEFTEPSLHKTSSNQSYKNVTQPVHVLQPELVEEYVPASHELPLSPHHKQPPYDFSKSSYEVPIYDPIPFDASNNDEQEFYPPNHYELSEQMSHIPSETQKGVNYVQIDDPLRQSETMDIAKKEHASERDASSTPKTKPRSNRKRHRQSSTSKHILDVPELKKAYEASKQFENHFPSRDIDTEVNASSFVEKKYKYIDKSPELSNDNSYGSAWNPMRIFTSSQVGSTTATGLVFATIPNSSPTIKQLKRTGVKHRQRPSPSSSIPLSSPPPFISTLQAATETTKIASVSIEKSRSNSYYDGTLAPPTLTVLDLHNTDSNNFQTPPTPFTHDIQSKDRTTKSAFDRAHFKTPRNERENARHRIDTLGQNLPRNHKLY